MNNPSDIILDHNKINHKITRLAWQIYENNMDEEEIRIVGIQKRGMYLAKRITEELKAISGQNIILTHVVFDEQSGDALYDADSDLAAVSSQVVIMVDDVLNTGRTIMRAMMPLVARNAMKIQIAVLASRSHRQLPLKADFVGISMATTLQEHLSFDNSSESDLKLILK